MPIDSNDLGPLSAPKDISLLLEVLQSLSPEESWGKKYWYFIMTFWQLFIGSKFEADTEGAFASSFCMLWFVTPGLSRARVWGLWAVGICFHFLDISVAQTKPEPSSVSRLLSIQTGTKQVHVLAWLSCWTSNQKLGFLQLLNSGTS